MELKGGNGGLHGAVSNARLADCYIIDIDSFYPSIMINNSLLPKCRQPQRFTELLQMKRDGLKEAKLLLNSVYGLCPEAIRVTIAQIGQDLMKELIDAAGGMLIQVNTDGLIVYNADFDAIKRWSCKRRMQYTIKHVAQLYQKDVNNYVYSDDTGKIYRKGTLSRNNIANKAAAEVLLGADLSDSVKNGALIDYCEIIPCDYYQTENARFQADFLRVVHVTDGERIKVDGNRVLRGVKEVNGALENYDDIVKKIDFDYYKKATEMVLSKWR